MRHERTGVILSTGGSAIVKAAYSSGKPAFGVGPGNVPVLVDTSADLDDAIPKIVAGKSFDYGTVCSSEQAIVAEASLRDRILGLLESAEGLPRHRGAEGRARQTADHAELDGQSATAWGRRPPKSRAWRASKCPRTPPSSAPKWAAWASSIRSPRRSFRRCSRCYFLPDFNGCVETCFALLKFGGLGHTAAIYSKNDARTREYAMRMPAYRVLVNTPAPQGSTGITTNVFPSMTLGCGAAAGNSPPTTSGPLHLINIKRLAYVARKPEEAFEMPLDYNAATYPPAAGAPAGDLAIDRVPWRPPWSATWLRAAWRPRPAPAQAVRPAPANRKAARPRTPPPTWWIASSRGAAAARPSGGYG